MSAVRKRAVSMKTKLMLWKPTVKARFKSYFDEL